MLVLQDTVSSAGEVAQPGLQAAELAEAARIGLTAEDLESLISDLAQKEFAQLERMLDCIDKQEGGITSRQEAVDQWARQQSEKWVRESFTNVQPWSAGSTAPNKKISGPGERVSRIGAARLTEQAEAGASLILFNARQELMKMQMELDALKSRTGAVGHKREEGQLSSVHAISSEKPVVGEAAKPAQERMSRKIAEIEPQRDSRPIQKRLTREELPVQAKGRADQRSHELALQKRQSAQHKAEMRDAADRHAREVIFGCPVDAIIATNTAARDAGS